MTISKISWDWKESPTLDELNKSLNKLGVFVYEDPSLDGSDSLGYIFSNKKLTDKELNEISEND